MNYLLLAVRKRFFVVVDVVNWKLTFDFYFATKYRDVAMNDDTR